MITSLFKKSTPLNYTVLVLAVLGFFFMYQLRSAGESDASVSLIEKGLILIVVFASLFVVNFIAKKNGLSKDSSYTVLFFLMFLLFFPSIFNNFDIIVANFFVLLALRRLISLQSLKASKEKIFDASMWIFVATMFHFWCILFIVLVFLAIILHVARDYRNWLLPFIAFFGVSLTFLLFALMFDEARIQYLYTNSQIDVSIDYFTNNFQNLALSLYATIALFFVVSLLMTLSNRPLMLHTSYHKIIMFFIVGVTIYVISPNKSNDLLLFTSAPLAMMATSHIEITHVNWQKEVILGIAIACGFLTFFTQL
ncbi:MAG TPA: DUF6427 family protein [Flavobacterium sp.]|jgi:hypothetical protein